MNGTDVGRAIRACEKNEAPAEMTIALVDDWSYKRILEEIVFWYDSDDHGSDRRDEGYVANVIVMMTAARPKEMVLWFKAITEPIRIGKGEGREVFAEYLKGTVSGCLMSLKWANENRSGIADDQMLECATILSDTILSLPDKVGSMAKAGKLAKELVQQGGLAEEHLWACLAFGISGILANNPLEILAQREPRQLPSGVFDFIKEMIYGRLSVVFKTSELDVLARLLEEV